MPEVQNGCRIFRDCTISGVYKRLNTEQAAYREIIIEIKIEGDKVPSYEYLHMSFRSELGQELLELKSGKRDRVYGTYGMGDIDIVSSPLIGNYSIEWSPMPGVYDIFDFRDRKKFEEKFIAVFTADSNKEALC